MFAFRAGIIDGSCVEGGICFDDKGAYAIVMKGSDERDSTCPDSFTYRCNQQDKGRFRLTSATFRSRYGIRVLRSHSLVSMYRPQAGLRYDGLYVSTGIAETHRLRTD
jgi:hypothetical protein